MHELVLCAFEAHIEKDRDGREDAAVHEIGGLRVNRKEIWRESDVYAGESKEYLTEDLNVPVGA